MVKPTNLAEWGTGAAPIVEPSTPQKQAGFAVSDRPPAQWFNWFWNLVHLWIVWLDSFESTAHAWSAFQTFSQFENTTAALVPPVTWSSITARPPGCSVNVRTAAANWPA